VNTELYNTELNLSIEYMEEENTNGWTGKYKGGSVYFLMRFWSIQLDIRWWTWVQTCMHIRG